ncbi:MAG: radical SAM protein, partial [Armatimonadota bacterium]
YLANGVPFNMGLLSIATVLTENKYKVLCMNPHQVFVTKNDELKRLIRLYNPAMVGFYVTADNVFLVKEIASLIKSANKSIKIAVGGPQACAIGEGLFENKDYDIVITGEGEYAFLELLDFYVNNKGILRDIKGIMYKESDQVIKTQVRPLIENLDELPVPNIILSMQNMGYYPVITGRGCPNNCLYCYKSKEDNKYRLRTAEKVAEEIITAVEKFGFNVINILDDTFTADPERAKAICKALMDYQKKSKRNLIFYCDSRIDALYDNPDMLELMVKCGFEKIQISINSGNQKILDNYGEGVTLDKIKEVVKKCYELNIATVVGSFIIGGPGDTKKTVEDSMKFAEELVDIAPGMIEFSVAYLCPYPGTPVYDDPGRFGLKILDSEFKTGMPMNEPHMLTKSLILRDLNALKLQFLSHVGNYMMGKVPDIYPGRVAKHFYLSRYFGFTSQWLSNFYMSYTAMGSFFDFSLCPRFTILGALKEYEWRDIHPIRTLPDVIYEPWDDSIVIKGSFREFRITNKVGKEAYRLAAAKIKLIDIVKEIKNKFELTQTEEEIWLDKIKPLYEQLEKLYYMAFYF